MNQSINQSDKDSYSRLKVAESYIADQTFDAVKAGSVFKMRWLANILEDLIKCSEKTLYYSFCKPTYNSMLDRRLTSVL